MPRKRKSSRRHFKSRGFRHRESDPNRCHYCGSHISGMPHFCKFCGEKHCDSHLLPEDHNCPKLKRGSGWIVPQKTNFRPSDSESNYERPYSTRSFGDNHHPSPQRKMRFRAPRIRIPRINIFFKALILAVLTFVLAYYYPQYDLLLWIEAGAWLFFSFILFKKAFRWANRVSMSDDLSFFGLRILGGIITVVGVYVLFATLFASVLVRGSAPQSIPLYCLIAGAIFLGAFIAFRTNRRHHVVGIWNA
jgi:hypothetical protein